MLDAQLIQTLEIHAEVQHGWWTVTRFWSFCSFHVDSVICRKDRRAKKTPINDQCQSHSSDRNAQRLRARHCALCLTWQTAGSDHIVTFTLSPNVVSDVGGILNKQHHSNHTVMRQGGTQKPSVSYWGGYNMAERAQHPFCFCLFYLNNTEGKSGLSVMWGKDLWIYNDSIIFPRHCLQPWAEKHRNVTMENLSYNSPRHSYLRSEKKTSSWEKTKRPNRPPANVLS